VLRPIGGKEHVQIVAGGFRIAKLKLNRLSFLNEVADRDGSCLLVCTDKIAYQKVTTVKTTPMLVDGDADVQSPMSLAALWAFQRFEDLL
jgi:hypothetical protein